MPINVMGLFIKPTISLTWYLFFIMTSEERKELRYQRRKAKRLKKKKDKYKDCFDYEKVFTFENLYKAYIKCRANVGWKSSTQKYIVQAPLNVYQTYKKLMAGRYKSDGFYEFDLYERGKHRHIKSVTINERVVQRCLCDNALVPVITKSFIYDNGASLPNKGYHFAIRRLERHLHYHFRKHGQEGYILLFDFSKFFENVDHALVKKILAKEFDDERLLNLTYHFIDMFGDKGMGLGSQISQTLALASADKLDHYVKETLRIKGYGRYMDDGYIIHRNKAYLNKILRGIRKICDELGIVLNEKKTQIVKLSHGFTWLKARFYILPTGKIVKKIYKRSVTKMRQKLKKFVKHVDSGKMTYMDVYCAFQSWKAYALHFNAYHTIQNMSKLYNDLFVYRRREEDYVF